MNDNPKAKILVEGYCDWKEGTPAYNKSLGDRRATSIEQYLIDLGLKELLRIEVLSMGDELATPDADPTTAGLERKAQFIVPRDSDHEHTFIQGELLSRSFGRAAWRMRQKRRPANNPKPQLRLKRIWNKQSRIHSANGFNQGDEFSALGTPLRATLTEMTFLLPGIPRSKGFLTPLTQFVPSLRCCSVLISTI